MTDTNLLSPDTWVIVDSDPFFTNKFLAFTKTGVDARPIVQTRVEYEPCLDPTKTS